MNRYIKSSSTPDALSKYTPYEFITRYIPNGGFVIQAHDDDLTYKFVSEGYAGIMGYTVEEFLEISRNTINTIVDCMGHEEEIDDFNAKAEVGDEYVMQYKLRCKDGSWKLVEDHGRLVQNADGTEEFWSVVIDINAQERLKEAEAALEKVRRMTEEQEAQIEEISALNSELEERQAQLEESTAEQESQLEEISTINADLEKKSSMLAQQLGIVGSLANTFQALYTVDMTDRSFVALGRSREQVETVIGRKGDAKASFAAMCNYLVIPEHKAEMEAFTDLTTLQERLADKPFISHQYCGQNGSWSEGFFVVVNRNEAGLLTDVLWGVRAIDEFKQKEIKAAEELTRAKEAAEAANDAKTTFLNNMSHDIRTPMNAILGFTKLIERDIEDPDKVAVSLGKIKNSGHYLLSIINNVLDMARIESGKVSLNLDFVDLRDPEANIVSVFEEELHKKSLKATFDLDIEHRYVLVDIAKTNQIVVNLVSNAIKYTPAGGSIVMKMQEFPCAKPGYGTYCWSIKDTGIGMSKEFQETIFESFTREQNTTQSKIVGTGLGMAIVKRLVDFLGGTIEVESEPGKGTTFRVWLDHQLVEKPEDYIKNQAAHIPENIDFSGKRILLAEDNDLNAEIAMAILSDEGFIVERAEDGVACVEKLNNVAAGYYDVILMDIQMPYLDGYGTTEKIRQLTDVHKANIPILAMTANAFEEDKRKALATGMDGFCTKPLDIEQLNRELARVFQ